MMERNFSFLPFHCQTHPVGVPDWGVCFFQENVVPVVGPHVRHTLARRWAMAVACFLDTCRKTRQKSREAAHGFGSRVAGGLFHRFAGKWYFLSIGLLATFSKSFNESVWC